MMRVEEVSFQNDFADDLSWNGSRSCSNKSRETGSGNAGSAGSGQWLMYCIIGGSINEKSQHLDDEELAYSG